MTTFQTIVSSILQALSTLLPFSTHAHSDFLTAFLGWSTPSVELQYWISLLSFLTLLFFFRFDWLGILSAALKTIFKPKSILNIERILDQQIVLFLVISSLPSMILNFALGRQWFFLPEEFMAHPIPMIIGSVCSFTFLSMGITLNRRLRGLNHLRLIDAVSVGSLLLLSMHPSFSIILLLWSALAMAHYHWEAIFKYSYLILTLHLFTQTLLLGSEIHFSSIFPTVGAMNIIVASILTVVTVWITLENLQKKFSENNYRFFRWVQLLLVVSYAAILIFRS